MPDAVDLNEYTIFPATPEQQQEIVDVSYSLYHIEYPKEKWQARFDTALNGLHSQDGAHQAWVLARRDDPHRTAVSHVQTERRPGWRQTAHGIEDIVFYGITFVQTPAEHHRKGFSHRLLRTLHYVLAPHIGWPDEFGEPPTIPADVRAALPPAAFSILSSVAPPGFYRNALIGPTSAQRHGWEDRRHENSQFRFSLPASPLPGSEQWAWEPIFQRDLEALQPVLTKIKRREVEAVSVEKDEVVVHPDPSHPGLLEWANDHWTCGPFSFAPIPADHPVGLRFYLADSSSSPTSPPPVTVDTPLVLFLPHGAFTGHHLMVTLTANLTPKLMPAVITAMGQVAKGLPEPFDKAELWGHGEEAPFVQETKKLVEGEWTDRSAINWIPCGVAWYGDEKNWRVDGYEFWSAC